MQGGGSFYALPSLYSAASLAVLKAVTPVHAGVGRTAGLVDLPVQRDEHGYPAIYGSSIKGALKTALLYSFAKELGGDYERAKRAVTALLGPEPGEPEAFESSVAVLDAYSLAVPARSLRGVYAYVTSPALLGRLCDRVELLGSLAAGSSGGGLKCRERVEGLEVEEGVAVCADGDGCERLKVRELDGKAVLVEEVLVEVRRGGAAWLSGLAKLLKLDRPLLVLDDDTARGVIERSIMRYTRVRLSRATKTVEEGGLWTEEYLPPRTVLHALLLFKRPPLTRRFVAQALEVGEEQVSGEGYEERYLEALGRLRLLSEEGRREVEREGDPVRRSERVAEAVKEAFRERVERLGGYLVLGGLETVGRGVVRLELIEADALKGVFQEAPGEGG